ncbi:MAG: type II toxin-antitoxin system ParD family antitoxin [Pirellulaceae bacterium]
MPTKNINLTQHYFDFVEQLVASGRYKNASEVLRAGLRLLEQSTTQDQELLAFLRTLASEGFDQIDQGRGIDLSSEGRLAGHIAKLGRRAGKSVDRRQTD